jgi:delta 1-pyrroline-5-carboxylate dehydrogenase
VNRRNFLDECRSNRALDRLPETAVRASLTALFLLAVLVSAPHAGAAQSADPPQAGGELALARELIAQREHLDRMRLDPGMSKDALLAQERKLMEVRSRLAAALAGELARQSADAQQWRQAWESMKGFLREKLRNLLDEPQPGTTPT